MGCGCGRASKPAVPVTSGDYVAVVPSRFKVVSTTETDPETGEPVVLSEHADYRSASIARAETGGKLRQIKEPARRH